MQATIYLQGTDKQSYLSKNPKHTPIRYTSLKKRIILTNPWGIFKEEIKEIVMRHQTS